VIGGLACLAVAMCGALLLIATKLFGAAAGLVTVAVAAVPFATLWFAMPLHRRAQVRAGGVVTAGRRDEPSEVERSAAG